MGSRHETRKIRRARDSGLQGARGGPLGEDQVSRVRMRIYGFIGVWSHTSMNNPIPSYLSFLLLADRLVCGLILDSERWWRSMRLMMP